MTAQDLTVPLLPYEWPGTYFIDETDIENVTKVLLARSPFRFYGHDVQHFADQIEAAYCKRIGRRYALAVNSGTAALCVALNALGVGPGDEVLLPGFMWVSCLAAIVRAGAIPRLVDIDDTFCMNPDDLERKIGPHSRAIMAVHMSGNGGALNRILDIARAHKLPLLEDCAQANGASFRGRPLGSFGDMAVFSFQLNKNITAGEGGMIVCDEAALYDRAVACHDLGYPRGGERRSMSTEDASIQLWGQGSRMSELAAAMLVAQEPRLDTIVGKMRAACMRLYRELDGVGGARARRLVDPDGDCGCHLLLIWPDAETCRRMVSATREAGVRPAAGGYNNVCLDPGWGLHLYYLNPSLVNKRGLSAAGRPWTDPANAFAAGYSYAKGALPQADDLFARTSIIVVSPMMTDETVDQIIAIFKRCAG